MPVLIRRFHETKEQGLPYVTCWGGGSPLREFMYLDGLADLCVFLINHYSGNETVNAGTGPVPTVRQGNWRILCIILCERRILFPKVCLR